MFFIGFQYRGICRCLFDSVLLLILLLSTTCIANPARISTDQTLIIGGNKDFAPYEYLNAEGKPDGYNIDLIKAVAEQEGLRVKIVLDTWHNTRHNMEEKKIDAVTGMIYSRERDKQFDFSVPYIVIPYSLFKRDETPLHSLDDVKGKEIIVVNGVYAHDWLTENQFTDSIITVESATEALELLATGKHDFVLMPRLHGIDLLDNLKITNVDVAGPPVLTHRLGFAVAEGNSALLAELNEGLMALQHSGEYDDIYQKWFSVDQYTKRLRRITQYAWPIFAAIILFLLAILCWNWLLKRAVRQKTRELCQSETRLQQILEGIPIATYVIDESRTVTHWNKACELLTGKSAGEIIGTNGYCKALYKSQSQSIVDLLFDNALTKRVEHYEGAIYRESSVVKGTYETETYFSQLGIDGKWLYGAAVLLKDDAGKINGAIETWQDLTEYKQVERQLIQSQKMEAVGTLAGGIAHDFNNILTAINGHADIALMTAGLQPQLKNNLAKIRSAGMRAKKLVNQILTFSRQAELIAEPIQVSVIVEETLALLKSSLATNITILQDIQTEALTLADPTHIHQIVMNLCTNASHAMAESGGILRVQLSKILINESEVSSGLDLLPGSFIKLTVSDTGQGIPKDIQDKILHPFFTTKKRGEGTGMGLSVTHGIVKQYGGVLTFHTDLGKGTIFQVYFPAMATNE